MIRKLTFTRDGHVFDAPVSWIQTDGVEAVLSGREVVFDLFDVVFKQAKETILFKKRRDSEAKPSAAPFGSITPPAPAWPPCRVARRC